MEPSTQQQMADYFRAIASWRRVRAEDYDRDPRNIRCASGLEQLADHVLNLPDDDERVVQLTRLALHGGMLELEQRAHVAVSRFRFHTPETSLDGMLEHIIELQLADISEAGRFGGRLPEGDNPWERQQS
ncbi:MAG TPA: hypothetical protein VMM78_15265 [Thermomicrobiales bacterium]|nr:hypothetical protein [Thermomicrobiales bacterium]